MHGDLNSGPPTCQAALFPTEPGPQPLAAFFYRGSSQQLTVPMDTENQHRAYLAQVQNPNQHLPGAWGGGDSWRGLLNPLDLVVLIQILSHRQTF